MFLPCEFMLIIEKVNKREGERGWKRERERETQRQTDTREMKIED